jgi:hypothetical protein
MNKGTRMSLLITVDYFTCYIINIVLPRMDIRTECDGFIERILTVYRYVARVRTDSGREFAGEFAALMEALQIERVRMRSIPPWTNSCSKRIVG